MLNKKIIPTFTSVYKNKQMSRKYNVKKLFIRYLLISREGFG